MIKSTRVYSKVSRPSVTGTGLFVRLQAPELAQLDSWIKEQKQELSRPAAIRVLLARGLTHDAGSDGA